MSGTLSRRPLTASLRDQNLYVSMPPLDLAVAALEIGTNVFIFGPAGSGKTTLARHVQAAVENVLVVRAEEHRTASDLIDAIVIAIAEDERTTDSFTGSETTVYRIEAALEERSQRDDPLKIIVIDGASEEQISLLFGRFRDVMWQMSVQWVVTSRRRPDPPADSFFDRVIELEPWNDAKLTELLERRAPDADAGWISRLVDQIAPATPTEAILAFQTLLTQPQGKAGHLLGLFENEAQQVRAMPTPLRSAYMAVRTLGPVSASDERLLDAMGVSRSRLTHYLKALEDRGLLRAYREGKKVLYNTVPKELLLEA